MILLHGKSCDIIGSHVTSVADHVTSVADHVTLADSNSLSFVCAE